ncbi:AAA family ATPase [Desulfospira joergensenii]|uniref:cytidylate kinase-like family protein n=1 Tax=Desulfospira joergensenii TaxID=53329 RepID=UPI0003B32FCE|nr:cytidylate kinase family protein [Desulfospira joergensenii]
MPVLILTSDNEEIETEIARKTARRLGYKALNREFLEEVANTHGLDPKKLAHAMDNTPSLLKRMPEKTWNYFLSCVEMEVLGKLLEDDWVCWGLGAHLYVMVVSHVLKVKLIGNLNTGSPKENSGKSGQVRKKMIADETGKKDKWSMAAFNRKQSDADLYDMVINLEQIQEEEVIETLVTTLGYPRFKAMTYSKNTLSDMALAARVRNALLKTLTDIRVTADNGTVVVTTTSVKREKTKKIEAIKRISEKIEGIGYLEVHWNKDILTEASTSFR